MTLEELVIECIKNGIRPCCVDYDPETNSLCYELNGFSKSGTATLEKTATGGNRSQSQVQSSYTCRNIRRYCSCCI